LIELHSPLARRLSLRFCRHLRVPRDDAVQIGMLGLIEAARQYRPEFHTPFARYAYSLIQRACNRYGPELVLSMHVPFTLVRLSFRRRLRLKGSASAGRSQGVRELRTDRDLREPTLAKLRGDLERVANICSLSDPRLPAFREARQIVEDRLVSGRDAGQLGEAVNVHRAVDRLPVREAQIIRLRYGFDGCPAQSLAAVGQLFGLSRQRVQQIQERAEERLRIYFAQAAHAAAPARMEPAGAGEAARLQNAADEEMDRSCETPERIGALSATPRRPELCPSFNR
jgi:RNA polymerase primary sigma factor